ncbi:cilia- and flagella-associated protein 184 [Dipodomys merriami]|uniref:cilia- and flagella-associated protein 184-like n=1 Tax=Dipodomys merriami TaxID=94247 RepID=UPI00385597C5
MVSPYWSIYFRQAGRRGPGVGASAWPIAGPTVRAPGCPGKPNSSQPRPADMDGDERSEPSEDGSEDGESLDTTRMSENQFLDESVEPETEPGWELEAGAEELETAEIEAWERAVAEDQPEEAERSPAASEAPSGDRSAEAQEEEPAESDWEVAEAEEPAAARRKETGAFPRGSLPLTTIAEEAAAERPRRGGEEEEEAAAAAAAEEEEEEKGAGAAAKGRGSEPREGRGPDGGAGDRAEGSREALPPSGRMDDEEWSEEVKKQQEQQLRRELLDQYHLLLMERNRYRRYNAYLQHRICESLRKKKGLEAAETPERAAEPEAPEKEQAYLHYLAILEELRKQEVDDLEWYHQELGQLKQQCQEKQARVEKEWRRFQALKKQVVMQVMGSCRLRGGRQAALREVEQTQALEDKKEKEMSAVRLENVQLKQSLVHFQTRMRAQEDLSEGLLLIDFEQLKIENQTFNEKVEERNEELSKLRNKVTNNVQTITHVKEKLHYVDMENACKKMQLMEIESQVSLGRDILTRTKQARDSLRMDNIKLYQKSGLLGKESLLRDLEVKVDKTAVLSQRLESLKRHHTGLMLSCKGVKQKIREAKAFLPS